MSNDKAAATTHGAECIKSLDEFRRTSGFLVPLREYDDPDTRTAMIDRAADLDKQCRVLTGLGTVGVIVASTNLLLAFCSALVEYDFWPPLLVGLFLASVTGGLFFARRVRRLELRVIRLNLKHYFRTRRERRPHVRTFENGHVAIHRGAITINPDAGRITERAIKQMAERAVREIQENGL